MKNRLILVLVLVTGCKSTGLQFNDDSNLNTDIENYIAPNNQEYIVLRSAKNEIKACLARNPEVLLVKSKESVSTENGIRQIIKRANPLKELVSKPHNVSLTYEVGVDQHGNVVMVRIDEIVGEISDQLLRKTAINTFNMKYDKNLETSCLNFGSYQLKIEQN